MTQTELPHSDESIERAFITLREMTQERRGRGISAVLMVEEQLKAALLAREAVEVPPAGALAMRVLQSELYPKLDDEERAQCDAWCRQHIASIAPTKGRL